MTNRDEVLGYLRSISPQAATNGQIRKATGVEPHQQVYQLTAKLVDAGLISGEKHGREWFFWVGEAYPISETLLPPESTHRLPPPPEDEPLSSRTMARLPKPSRTKVLSLTAACIVLLACAVLLAYFSAVEPGQMVMKARDWQEITFQTDITDEWRETHDPAVTNMTGAGIVAGESQYLLTGVTGAVHEPGPARWTGSVTVKAEEVEITVIEISRWQYAAYYDADSGLYYVRLCSDDQCIDYEPPFETLPSALLQHVAYRSARPETLLLSSAPVGNTTVLPALQIMANEPARFGWNMRRGCEVSLRRSFDGRSNARNKLVLHESCQDGRQFPSLWAEEMDGQAQLQYLSFAPLGGSSTLLLLPGSYQIQADGLGSIADSAEDYMLLIRAAGDGGAVQLVAQPQYLDVLFLVYLPITDPGMDESVAKIEPTTREVVILGPVGKIAIGLATTITDELSDVTVNFVDWPTFKWHNDLLSSEAGEVTPHQFLSGRGAVDSVIINGQETVPTRWDRLAPDIRGALLTALGALLGATITVVARLAVRHH